MKNILILTENYPAIRGEFPFLEQELTALRGKYHVEIYCRRKYSGSSQYVPGGIPIHWRSDGKSICFKNCIRALFSGDVWKEILCLVRAGNFNIETLKFCVGYFCDALSIASDIRKLPITEDTLIYSFWGSALAYAATRLKRKIHCSCAIRLHRFDLYKYVNKCNWQPFKKVTDKCADRVIFIGNEGKNYYLSSYGIKEDPDKHIVIRLGAEDHGTAPWEASETVRILSCSNIVPVKRIDRIISFISKLNGKVNWVHIGDGSQREIIEQSAHEKLDGRSNIGWRFIGEKPHDEVMDYFKCTPLDFLVNMSESEGLPVSMMEAMSFGVPVIGTDVGAVSEIIDNGVNGFLLPEEDAADAAAEAVNKYMKFSAAEKENMRRESRLKWKKDFQSTANAQKLCAEFTSI